MATTAADTSTVIAGNVAPTQRPDFQRPEYLRAQKKRALCNAVYGGTDTVREGGQTYLPKWPAEKPEHYAIRAAIVQVTRYYARTVEAAVGMICGAGTPVEVIDADPLIQSDIEDIDGQGTHIEVYAKHLAIDAVNGGFTAILVDYPPIPDGLELTHEDELKLGLRPFWVNITADRIPSWIVEVPNWRELMVAYAAQTLDADTVASYAKQVILRQVVIYEPTDVVKDAFGATCVDRYRVLRLTDAGVTYTVWEKRKAEGANGEHFIQIATGVMRAAGRQPFREIPLAIVYAGRKVAPFVAEPAMMSLAELNVDHYQVSADRRYLMKLCHSPTLLTIGIEGDQDAETGQRKPVEVGPNSVLSGPVGADAKYVSANPQALDSSKEEKEVLVEQMSALGMGFLGIDGRWNQTATGRVLDDAAEGATHSTIARGLQDGMEQAFRFHAMYRGVDKAPSVAVKTVTASPQVDAQIVTILWQAVVANSLDVESWIEYIRTGALPDDIQARLDVMKLSKAMDAPPPTPGQGDATKTCPNCGASCDASCKCCPECGAKMSMPAAA